MLKPIHEREQRGREERRGHCGAVRIHGVESEASCVTDIDNDNDAEKRRWTAKHWSTVS